MGRRASSSVPTTANGVGNYSTQKPCGNAGGEGQGAAYNTSVMTTKAKTDIEADLVYKNINAEVAEHLTGITTNYYGYQATEVRTTGEYKDTFAVRLVATLSGDYKDLKNVGFIVSATYKDASGNTVDKTPNADGIIEMNTIYDSITSTTGGVESTTTTHTAASLGGDYIFVLVCPNIPADAKEITFTITPFYTDANSNRVCSATEVITITNPADLSVGN